MVVQVADARNEAFLAVLAEAGVAAVELGRPVEGRTLTLRRADRQLALDIDALREDWYALRRDGYVPKLPRLRRTARTQL